MLQKLKAPLMLGALLIPWPTLWHVIWKIFWGDVTIVMLIIQIGLLVAQIICVFLLLRKLIGP